MALAVKHIERGRGPCSEAYRGGVALAVKHIERGRGPCSEEDVENFRFLGKNVNILHQLFYHSISVTKTAKENRNRMVHPMDL